jgi:predicted extracellular nuclease
MKNIVFLLPCFALFLFSNCAEAQPPQAASARIAFYNTENLFDTINNKNVIDEEFLPDGKMKWTKQRYEKKLAQLSKVILEIGNGSGPEIIGLCEVENKGVLVDLTQKTPLKKQKYGIVHYDSPDNRGIDVALLYKKSAFRVLESKPFIVPQPSDTLPPTRSILYVKGILGKNDTLCIFVNHWPSRRGGPEESAPRRIMAAEYLKQLTDSVMKAVHGAQVVAIGDFNDEPTDASLQSIAHSVNDSTSPGLRNMMSAIDAQGEGTHYYRKEKNTFDQILVSNNLFGKRGYYVTTTSAHIFKPEWIMGENYKGDPPAPLRTYAGSRYIGGYSDHLPVYVDLYLAKK